jgi:hypothetical protein
MTCKSHKHTTEAAQPCTVFYTGIDGWRKKDREGPCQCKENCESWEDKEEKARQRRDHRVNHPPATHHQARPRHTPHTGPRPAPGGTEAGKGGRAQGRKGTTRTLETRTRQARAHTHTHTTHTTHTHTHTHQSADEDNHKTETVLGGIEPECHSSANSSAGGWGA